ncbi:hypothetical protein HDU93_002689 [Gonapodya sp. JEL0774]|nr:hypothetical protein HDU93_002689 [Gonapodya sp. JEL0774]
MPWEQLNNQLIEFRGACGVANVLDRVLLLPKVGFRQESGGHQQEWNFSFDVESFQWEEWDRYFDLEPPTPTMETVFGNERRLNHTPPRISSTSAVSCRVITLDNLIGLYYDDPDSLRVGELLNNPIARATNEEQLRQYYGTVLDIRHGLVRTSPQRLQFLSKEEVIGSLGDLEHQRMPVIAFGASFWLYDFGKEPQEYPLKHFADYMDSAEYRDVVIGMKWRPDITELARALRHTIGQLRNGELFVAVHVRQGDYQAKCDAIRQADLREHCYPSAARMKIVISEAIAQYLRTAGGLEKLDIKSIKLYIATNPGTDKTLLTRDLSMNSAQSRSIGGWPAAPSEILFVDDLFRTFSTKRRSGNQIPPNSQSPYRSISPLRTLDPIERVLLDIELGVLADIFIGNYFSSLTRTIIERRALDGGRGSLTF